MRVTSNDGTILDVRFHKRHRVVDKGRFKGRQVVDTACVVSEMVGCAAGKIAFEPIIQDIALHCPKDRYNKYMGKKVSLKRALSKSELTVNDKCLLSTAFEKEFAHCK